METNEKLQDQEQINPADIVFDESSDSDMPVAETENYDQAKKGEDGNKKLKPTYKFTKLFEECLGKLPYGAVLSNSNDKKIKLVDLIRFVEAKHDLMTVDEMNTILAFVANCPLEHVRPLMEIVEDSKRQVELWTLVD